MEIANQIIAFICDDIREEIGNKVSLMGIYGDNIVFPVLPAAMPKLCLYIVLNEVNTDVNTFKIKVFSPVDGSPIEFNIPAQVDQTSPNKNTRIAVVLSPFKVVKTGEARVELSANDEKNSSVIYRFNIMTSDQVQK